MSKVYLYKPSATEARVFFPVLYNSPKPNRRLWAVQSFRNGMGAVAEGIWTDGGCHLTELRPDGGADYDVYPATAWKNQNGAAIATAGAGWSAATVGTDDGEEATASNVFYKTAGGLSEVELPQYATLDLGELPEGASVEMTLPLRGGGVTACQASLQEETSPGVWEDVSGFTTTPNGRGWDNYGTAEAISTNYRKQMATAGAAPVADGEGGLIGGLYIVLIASGTVAVQPCDAFVIPAAGTYRLKVRPQVYPDPEEEMDTATIVGRVRVYHWGSALVPGLGSHLRFSEYEDTTGSFFDNKDSSRIVAVRPDCDPTHSFVGGPAHGAEQQTSAVLKVDGEVVTWAEIATGWDEIIEADSIELITVGSLHFISEPNAALAALHVHHTVTATGSEVVPRLVFAVEEGVGAWSPIGRVNWAYHTMISLSASAPLHLSRPSHVQFGADGEKVAGNVGQTGKDVDVTYLHYESALLGVRPIQRECRLIRGAWSGGNFATNASKQWLQVSPYRKLYATFANDYTFADDEEVVGGVTIQFCEPGYSEATGESRDNHSVIRLGRRIRGIRGCVTRLGCRRRPFS